VLILGTLPGPRSLATHQYYAHPQNAFWPVMESLAGPLGTDYTERAQRLMSRGIALWDVLAAAPRAGALDSRIERERAVANDFHAFFLLHPGIRAICFNGAEAGRLYQRFVVDQLLPAHRNIATAVLPSTSPARTLSLATKRDAWAKVLKPLLE
jgi:hypoxanthine-DNA glycosylase